VKRAFDNPHVAADTERGGPGHLPGCLHRSCPKAGVTWQCVSCDLIHTYPWKAIEGHAETYLEAYGDGVLDAIPLPPCPRCGALAFLNNADIFRGLDDPHHYTQRAIDEHILERPKLKGRFALNRASLGHDAIFQGEDFSHLPEKMRPDHHRRVEL